MITILLILALLDPSLTARWDGPGAARIAWRQPDGVALTCLSRNSILIRCWSDLPAGASVVELGSVGPLDGAMRPQVGDVFTLQQDGAVWRAPLKSVVLLPMLRR